MVSRSARVYATSLAVATAAFAAVAVAALAWEEAAELDVRFVRWVHRTAPESLVDAMRVLTYLGSAAVLALLAGAAALLLARRGLPRAAAFVLTAFVASEALDQALKAAFRRTRPELENPFVRLTTYSFPSGHAFAATATYGAIALVAASAVTRRGAFVTTVAAVIVTIVAASRVILGVHYLLDVLAGVAGGIALLSALLLVFRESVIVSASRRQRKEQAERARLDV